MEPPRLLWGAAHAGPYSGASGLEPTSRLDGTRGDLSSVGTSRIGDNHSGRARIRFDVAAQLDVEALASGAAHDQASVLHITTPVRQAGRRVTDRVAVMDLQCAYPGDITGDRSVRGASASQRGYLRAWRGASRAVLARMTAEDTAWARIAAGRAGPLPVP